MSSVVSSAASRPSAAKLGENPLAGASADGCGVSCFIECIEDLSIINVSFAIVGLLPDKRYTTAVRPRRDRRPAKKFLYSSVQLRSCQDLLVLLPPSVLVH